MCRLIYRIRTLDLWLLLKMRKLFHFISRWLNPAVKISCLMALGAGILIAYAFLNAKDNSGRFNCRKSDKYSKSTDALDSSESCSSSVEREIVRLRTKAFSLENMLRRMKLQLSKFYTCIGHEEYKEMADFASEAVGGFVLDTPDTEPFYYAKSNELTVFGIPIWRPSYHTPRKVIKPWTQAGECWAFKGSYGKITIDLAQVAIISHVTLEHIPASASITGIIDSAPKKFSVLGQIQDEFVYIGSFTYNINGPPSQTFPVKEKKNTPFKRVQLEVQSNWGSPLYTCIYRFKVHGKLFVDFNYL